MSKIEARGSGETDNLDWNRAWNVVFQLAAARGTTLRKLGGGNEDAAAPSVRPGRSGLDDGKLADSRRAHTELVSSMFGADTAAEPARFVPVAPDQLARDIAEIERAAAVLRRAEPALQPQVVGLPAAAEPRATRSIWLLVGVIWLTAMAVVSCAAGTIALLLG